MNKTFKFVCQYGVLKKNIFGKYTNKLKSVIDVKTVLHFDNQYLEVFLYGIDRNNGVGITNEYYTLYYKNIKKIVYDEPTSTITIEELEGDINITTGEELEPTTINFIVDKNFLNDINIVFEELGKSGYFSLIQ